MIEVTGLTKRYGANTAVDDISFVVNDGEILGFLGPNGAGKTTTMNILTGYLSATKGTVKISGFDVLENPMEAKKSIGYMPEHPPLYLDMTVREYLGFVYDLKNVKMKKAAHIAEVARLFKVEHMLDRLISNLSKGYRQRVGFAQALLGNPEVLILDEPTSGLDPKQIIEVRNLIKQLGKRHTVILSSHILPEIQAVCERIIVINEGVIVADGTTDDLGRTLSGENQLVARIAGPQNEVSKKIDALSGVKSVSVLGVREQGTVDLLIETDPKVDIRKPLFGLLSDRNWPLMGLNNSELSLEDIFLKLTETVDKAAKPIDSHATRRKVIDALETPDDFEENEDQPDDFKESVFYEDPDEENPEIKTKNPGEEDPDIKTKERGGE